MEPDDLKYVVKTVAIRVLPVLLMVAATGVLFRASNASYERHLKQARDEIADFQEVTGTALTDLRFEAPRSRCFVWWQEYVLDSADFDYLQSLAKQILQAERSASSTDTAKNADQGAPSIDALKQRWVAYTAEHTLQDLVPEDFRSTFNKEPWRFVRKLPSEATPNSTNPQVALVGLLPISQIEKVPPTGRLVTPHATAQFCEYLGWDGEPVSLALLQDASTQAYPEHLIGMGGINGKFRTTEEQSAYRKKIEAAKSADQLQAVMHEYSIGTLPDGAHIWIGLPGVYLKLVENGKIPPPKPLTDIEHTALRKGELPGKQDPFIPINGFGAPMNEAVAKYAEVKHRSLKDTVHTILVALQDDPGLSIAGPLSRLNDDRTRTLALCAAISFLCTFLLMAYSLRQFFQPASDGLATKKDRFMGSHDEATPTRDASKDSRTSDNPHPSASSPPDIFRAPASAPPLAGTDVAGLHKSLREKGPIGRHFEQQRRMSASQRTKEIVEADTNLIKAQAEQIKTVLQNQNDIDDLQDEAAVRELKRQKREAELKAQIAAHKYTEEQAHQLRRDLKAKPAPPPAPEPGKESPKKPSRDDLIQAEAKRRDDRLRYYREMRQKDLIDDAALQRFQEEAQHTFETNVNRIIQGGR